MSKSCCQTEVAVDEKEVKTTMRTDEQKKKLINRLKRIEGQVRGLQNMIENDAYCNDILVQSAAINAAMNSFNKEMITNHMHGCMVKHIKSDNMEIVDEFLITLQKLMK